MGSVLGSLNLKLGPALLLDHGSGTAYLKTSSLPRRLQHFDKY